MSEDKKHIYHYCSLEAFYSIITTKSFWLFSLLLAFSVCFAHENYDTSIDSLKVDIRNLYTIQKEIKNSVDSLNNKFLSDNYISVKATEKSQEFYESSFSKIQNSYSDFLNRISIFVAVIGLVIAALSIYNNKSATDLKNQVKEELEKIKDFEGKLKEHKSKIDILYRIQSKKYLEAARIHISKTDNPDYWEHFIQLRGAYQAIMMVDLTPNDLSDFSCVDRFIEKYKKEDLNLATLFLSEVKEYMEYCEKTNKTKHLANARETWEKLCKKFGDENKINEAIKEFNGEV
jgi:hypothetical protein